MLRVVFMGSPDFAVPALEALLAAAGVVVVQVWTQPDRPAGRGRQLTPVAVRARALEAGVPCAAPTRMRAPETAAALAALAPDLVVVAAYGRILPPALLAVPARGCVNLHASLLPRHRGASPVVHALLAGDARTGVCLMQMDAGLDTGPVLARRELAIAADDTGGSLTTRLAHLAAALLGDSLPALAGGALVAQPQPEVGVTYAPLLAKDEGRLHFAADAATLARRVRALSPWPGTFVGQGAGRLVVRSAAAEPAGSGPTPASAAPGTIVAVGPKGVAVACGTGMLWLQAVRPAGRRDMPAAAWAAGRRLGPGDRLEAATEAA